MICTLPKKIAILLSSGLLTALVGLTIYCTFPLIMEKAIDKKLVLNEDSETYKYWKDLPVPLYLDFYFFNITNPEEIWAKTNKPILEEMGPYTFREERHKVDIRWNANGTVTYRQVRSWHFQSDRTNGSLDDLITTLNVPMVAAAMRAKVMDSDFVFFTLEEVFAQYNSSWFVTQTVRNLLFEGYDDPLMQLAKTFMNLPYDKFGWFYKRNNTDDGEINAHTGATDIGSVDEIFTWNGNRSVNVYSPPCNMINGSAGDLWPPVKTRSEKVTLFVTDICRSLSFSYLKDVESKGIRAYRFWADSTQLDNGHHYASTECFCTDGICLPSGGLNVSSCKFDAPAVISYPHFLFSDPVYSQGVIGMKPNPKKHRMYLDIVPEMGIPIDVAARMQINIVMEGIPNITQFENITERIYFPILWFSESAEVSDSIVSQLRLVTVTLPRASAGVAFFLVAAGAVLVAAAFLLALMLALRKNEPPYSTVR